MGCCRADTSSPVIRASTGTRSVKKPDQTVQSEYIVRYRKNGQMVTETFYGGRTEELHAIRLASLNKGTCQRVYRRAKAKEAS